MPRITAFAAALLWALLALPPTGSAADAVVLQLSGPATFEFAGYYAALWQGYYRDAGLDVTIRPGGFRAQTPIDPVRELTEGRAQFGIGSMQLVIHRAQGLPLLLVAPIFQQSGAAVYFRADSDFSSPATLVNAKLGRLPASDILDIELATALRAEGIDPARAKSVTIGSDQIVAALADKTIDAAAGSSWIVPWQAHEKGLVLKSFNPANYRVEYYGDSVFTLQHLESTDPAIVHDFRAATLKGWEYALRHPDDMIARLVADKPGEPPVADIAGFDRFQADVARRLSRWPDIPLGYSNADRWTQIEAGMIGAGVLERNADLTSFVYSPAGETPHRGRLGRWLAIVGAFGLAAIALGGAAWYARPLAARIWAHMPRRLPRRLPTAVAPVERIEPPPVPIAAARRFRARPEPVPPVAPLRPAPTNLNDVLGPLERRIRQQVRGKVRCRYSLLAELWPCRTEGGPVAAAVIELVGAATAAMDDDGTLIIGTRNIAIDSETAADYPGARAGQFARVTVRDSGPGLSDVEFERILDPATTSRPAIAKAAATMERLGGFLRVESAESIGTAVHLYFARVYDEPMAADTLPTAQVAE